MPRVFESHVSKSVPFYYEGHDLITKLSDFFLSEGSRCYDLGCSTGVLARKIAERNLDKKVSVIGLDVEPDMISHACELNGDVPYLTLEAGNVLDFELKEADMIVCYYTIQFIKPKVRQLVFNKIYNALNWGGAFILFEKVRAPDARFQDLSASLYTDYKLDNGYTPENIISKTQSLKGVLEPFSTQGNIDLMVRAGFVDIMTIMKYVCFEGFLAIK